MLKSEPAHFCPGLQVWVGLSERKRDWPRVGRTIRDGMYRPCTQQFVYRAAPELEALTPRPTLNCELFD